jgi:hypothetical protein
MKRVFEAPMLVGQATLGQLTLQGACSPITQCL